MAHLLAQFAHLCIAAGVIGYGTVGIGCQCDAQCGEHPYGGNANAVKTARDGGRRHGQIEAVGAEIAQHDGHRDGHHGHTGGNHTGADALDDDCGRACL